MGNTCSAKKFLCSCFSVPLTHEERLEYFSPRIAKMMRSRDQFSSDIDHEIESSKSHWSEVTPSAAPSEEDDEELNKQNWELFLELSNNPQWTHPVAGNFFQHSPGLKLGRKVAEGGQAEIFECVLPDGTVDNKTLAKVFKRGPLAQLQQQWPLGLLRQDVFALNCILHASMLDDGRFLFRMFKCWGDLRKLMDQAMIANNNSGPPFLFERIGTISITEVIMGRIAGFMDMLHARGVLHRDLKAANVLVLERGSQRVNLILGDFECSNEVVGTAFWRAPEILLALKNGDPVIFTEKADVYSYGMTCFEIAVGRTPFEGELEPCRASYDLVIEGHRPKLPSSLDTKTKILISSCWDPNPQRRPTFSNIRQFFCFEFK